MRDRIFYASLILIFIICQSTQCRKEVYDNCSSYFQDTVLLNYSVPNSNPVYHLNDTIWINSSVSDILTPSSGSSSFSIELNQLYLNAQPYQVITSTTLPQLQYANIEFNPVVIEGALQNLAYYGYNFLYKRTNSLNTLKIGFVAGRIGLYIISCANSRYSSGGMITFYKPGDRCTTYWGISAFSIVEQNKNYWDTLGVTAISISPNYGSAVISKNMRNYFFFNVIP